MVSDGQERGEKVGRKLFGPWTLQRSRRSSDFQRASLILSLKQKHQSNKQQELRNINRKIFEQVGMKEQSPYQIWISNQDFQRKIKSEVSDLRIALSTAISLFIKFSAINLFLILILFFLKLLRRQMVYLFFYDIIHVLMPFSQIIPPLPLPQSPKD